MSVCCYRVRPRILCSITVWQQCLWDTISNICLNRYTCLSRSVSEIQLTISVSAGTLVLADPSLTYKLKYLSQQVLLYPQIRLGSTLCNTCHVTADTLVSADPSLRCTLHVASTVRNQGQSKHNRCSLMKLGPCSVSARKFCAPRSLHSPVLDLCSDGARRTHQAPPPPPPSPARNLPL